jgi:2'-5' RNA ligase
VQPLVVTLTLERSAQEQFDALRRAHFPPKRNHLTAHVTLFHALPGEHEGQVADDLRRVADQPAFPVRVAGLRSLGRGVAYVLESRELDATRAALAGAWRPWLTPQDRQPHRPHVTVQNKVHPQAARELLDQLAQAFVPYDVTATGLALWRYLGGPWEPLALLPFLPAQAVDRH